VEKALHEIMYRGVSQRERDSEMGGRVLAEKRITFEGHSPDPKIFAHGKRENAEPQRIFLLSPANAGGVRARMLLNPDAQFDLAQRLRNSSVPLGEIFSFISGLYFRGKLAYAEKFKNPPPRGAGVHIITATSGLLLPEEPMTLTRLKSISASSVDPSNPVYRKPLNRDASRLRELLEPQTQVVLLGSIATPKYVQPLLEVFGDRLLFPIDFVGRGDMSRGGLLLRCCSAGSSLEYVSVLGATLRGRRPPKLKL
jgi:hypothetical protein